MSEEDRWTRKDALSGIAFFLIGVLVIAFSVLAMKNGYPIFIWGLGWLLGPLLLFLGGNAIVRGLRADGVGE